MKFCKDVPVPYVLPANATLGILQLALTIVYIAVGVFVAGWIGKPGV